MKLLLFQKKLTRLNMHLYGDFSDFLSNLLTYVKFDFDDFGVELNFTYSSFISILKPKPTYDRVGCDYDLCKPCLQIKIKKYCPWSLWQKIISMFFYNMLLTKLNYLNQSRSYSKSPMLNFFATTVTVYLNQSY